MRVTKDEEQSLYFFTSLNLWYLSVLIYTKIHPFGTGPLYIKLVKDMISLNHRTSSLKDWKKLKCRLVILPPLPPHFSTLKCFHCLTYYLEVFSSNHQTVSLHQLYILVDQNHMLCWTPLTSCIWNVSKNRIMLCQITQSLCTGLKPLIHSPIAFNVLAISSIYKCFVLYSKKVAIIS